MAHALLHRRPHLVAHAPSVMEDEYVTTTNASAKMKVDVSDTVHQSHTGAYVKLALTGHYVKTP